MVIVNNLRTRRKRVPIPERKTIRHERFEGKNQTENIRHIMCRTWHRKIRQHKKCCTIENFVEFPGRSMKNEVRSNPDL